jgi:hypothetical protein
MRISRAFFCLFFLAFLSGNAQTGWFESQSKKGELSVSWGYNRTWFSNSDIKFTGIDYDFVLKSIVAKDRPTEIKADPYLNPSAFTIPQYNFRVGYYFKDKWAISFGVDHMKYVMENNQDANISGYINTENSVYQGEFDNELINVGTDFLLFEHTDGLNYINFESHYFDNLYRFNEKISINYYGGGGLGVLFPKSNVKLMGFERNDTFHLAGMGFSAKAGLNLTLFKFFFLQTDFTTGYINMWDILTRPQPNSDRASQDFVYGMWNWSLGGFIPLSSNK